MPQARRVDWLNGFGYDLISEEGTWEIHLPYSEETGKGWGTRFTAHFCPAGGFANTITGKGPSAECAMATSRRICRFCDGDDVMQVADTLYNPEVYWCAKCEETFDRLGNRVRIRMLV
ncbi:MAG: hypothetical protein WC683_13130 [bacterium]